MANKFSLGEFRTLTRYLPDSTPLEYKDPNFPGIIDDHQCLNLCDITLEHIPCRGLCVLIAVPFIDDVNEDNSNG